MKRLRPLFAILVLASFVLPAAALPGPTGFTFDKGALFTVAGYTGSEALSGFPVLVRIAENSPQGFSYDDLQSKFTGDDIAFVDMTGAGIPFEIDTWNTNGTSLVWVRLPSMTNGTQFVMCWGSASSGKIVCPDNPWSDYAGVWHMGDPGDGVTNVLDSTANHLDGTTVASSKSVPAGKIGGARFITSNTNNKSGKPYDSGVTVDMTDDPDKLAAVDAIVPEFTASFWVRPQNNAQWWYFITRKAADLNPGWGLQNGSDGNNSSFRVFRAYGGTETDGNCMNLTGVNGLANGTWTKIDAVWMADKAFKLYVNGILAKEGTLVNAAENGNQTKLGIGGSMAPPPLDQNLNDNHKNGRGVYGDMDEVRLAAGAATADRIAADYATQTDPAFLTAGMAEPYGESDDPVAGVQVSDVAYTNATVTATVVKRGGAATSADVTVELSAASDFASSLWTTNYTVSADGDVQVFPVTGLSFGTSYYVRAVVSNTLDAVLTTPATSFATLMPGAPSGTATFLERGFTTLSATGAATAFGTGAQSAMLCLEASTDGFATIAAASAEVPAVAGAAETPITVSGLNPATSYALRLRIRNDWGVDTFVALPDAATRDVPFATTGLGWTFSADGSTVDVALGVSGVYDGATGSATLYWGDSSNPTDSQGSRPVNAAGDLSWQGLPVSAKTMYAKVVLSATLAGQAYSQTFSAPVSAGSTAVAVSDIMNHASAATAVRVHAGDVVTLPELSGTARYIVGNKLFASLDGNVVTALRPGIVGIHFVDNDFATNTLALLVLPGKIGNGNIYVYKEKTVSNHACIWTEPQRWELVGSDENTSCPNGADDIAIVPYYDETGVQFDIRQDVVLGSLYAGRYRDGVANISFRSLTTPKHGISFERTDGKPVVVQACSSSLYLGNNAYRTSVSFADSLAFLDFRGDARISGGWDGTSPNFPQGRFGFSAQRFGIPAGALVELVEMDTQGQSMGCTLSITRLAGGGTFWNHSSATMRVYGSPLFSGLLRDSGGHDAGTDDRTGPTYVRTDTLTNAAAEVVGWVGRSGAEPDSNFTKGVGALVSGWPHFYKASPAHKPWFPAKGTTMYGGLINNRDEEHSTGWIALASTNFVENADGSITTNVTVLATLPDKRLTDFLDIARGFVYLRTDCNNVIYPTTWFEAADLRHGDKATLYVKDSRVYGSGGTTNTVTILNGVSAHAVGGTGDPATGSVYPIVPWIATQAGPKAEEDMRFAAFDGNGLVVPIAHASDKRKSLTDYGANDNAYLWEKGISLSSDTTFNSLSVANDNYSKLLGAGRTLTLTSGGLILEDVSWMVGSSGIGTEDGGAANGALVLGDADHPAYVWARGAASVTEKAGPNQIWAPVTAPGGFVSAYTGNLVLGGNQTNILDELVVNAGTLTLGSSTTPCSLAKNLPIRIYANATLKLPNADSTAGKFLQFDGAAGWFGKVEVAAGVAAKCKKAFIRDYPESPEWETLPRGVYGSSESPATGEFVRDDLFAGAGTLEVVTDDRIQPTLMILR